MSSTHGEVPPRLAQQHLHYKKLLDLPGTQDSHVATPQGVLNAADPHQESLWPLGEELWVCPAQGDISLLHGLQGSLMFSSC